MPTGDRPDGSCSICRHPQADAINAALLDGEPQGVVAARFDVSSAAVHRHARAHLAAGDTGEPTSAGDPPSDALATMLHTQTRLLQVIESCEHLKQATALIQATRELRLTVEAIARLTGATDSNGALRQLIQSRDMEAIRTRLAQKLAALAGETDQPPLPPGGADAQT